MSVTTEIIPRTTIIEIAAHRDNALKIMADAAEAKLGTAPVDQEGLAKAIYDTNGAKAWPWELVGPETKADYLAKADAALKYIGATSTANETRARNLLADEVLRLRTELATACAERANEVVHNRELNAQVERTRALVRARGLTITLLEKIILGHADPGAVMRDVETGETAHIASDVRAVLGRLSGLAAENRRLETLNAQIDIARDQHLRDLLIERRKNGDVEQMARTNFDLRKELGDLQADDRERRFTIANKLLGQRRTTAPAWDELLVKIEERLKELTDMAIRGAPAPNPLVTAKKPIDRDRIRLALLDHELTRYADINTIADHLVKRLA